MADPQYPSTPQSFSFASRSLVGVLVGFSGATPRRMVMHEYLKRRGGRAEDMEIGPRTLDADLQFLGATAGKDYRDFENFIAKNPFGLLNHPIAGRWQAFCRGPQPQVHFQEAINQVKVRVSWIETELDATTTVDPPDVATAAQNVVGQQSTLQLSIAGFMAILAKAQTLQGQALNAIDTAINAVNSVTSAVTSPVSYMQSAINAALGATSAIVNALAAINTSTVVLNNDINNFVSYVSALFTSTSDTPPAASADAIANQLGMIQSDTLALESALLAAPARPASCAQAFADAEILLDNCMTLNDAMQAALPPTLLYTVPGMVNVVVLSQRLIQQFGLNRDPLQFASTIMGLNRIPNPAAIPAGTQLLVPTA